MRGKVFLVGFVVLLAGPMAGAQSGSKLYQSGVKLRQGLKSTSDRAIESTQKSRGQAYQGLSEVPKVRRVALRQQRSQMLGALRYWLNLSAEHEALWRQSLRDSLSWDSRKPLSEFTALRMAWAMPGMGEALAWRLWQQGAYHSNLSEKDWQKWVVQAVYCSEAATAPDEEAAWVRTRQVLPAWASSYESAMGPWWKALSAGRDPALGETRPPSEEEQVFWQQEESLLRKALAWQGGYTSRVANDYEMYLEVPKPSPIPAERANAPVPMLPLTSLQTDRYQVEGSVPGAQFWFTGDLNRVVGPRLNYFYKSQGYYIVEAWVPKGTSWVVYRQEVEIRPKKGPIR